MEKDNPCPCKSGKSFQLCCKPYLTGELPQSAEQLMRSRYTAFTKNNETHLLQSWHRSTRPQALSLADHKNIKWIELKVLKHESEDSKAIVEFIARYKMNGKAEKVHELSRFIKEDERWFYVDGDQY